MSKWAAVKKEPLTLEKNKGDQSKYYLSYPKRTVLDMMWANRDINVVEWANIPKFSALDNLMAPLRLLELFFVMLYLIWFLATSGCTFEIADINFEITNDKICLFLRMLLLAGYHKLPDHKMYWEVTLDTFVSVRSDSMPFNTFECILQNSHLCDNEQLDK